MSRARYTDNGMRLWHADSIAHVIWRDRPTNYQLFIWFLVFWINWKYAFALCGHLEPHPFTDALEFPRRKELVDDEISEFWLVCDPNCYNCVFAAHHGLHWYRVEVVNVLRFIMWWSLNCSNASVLRCWTRRSEELFSYRFYSAMVGPSQSDLLHPICILQESVGVWHSQSIHDKPTVCAQLI